MLSLGGTLPFHDGDGGAAGAVSLCEYVCDGGDTEEPMEMFDRYDAPLPAVGAVGWDFGDQFVIE